MQAPAKGVMQPVSNDDSDEDVPDPDKHVKRYMNSQTTGIRAFGVHGNDIARGLHASTHMSSSMLAVHMSKVTLAHVDSQKSFFVSGMCGAQQIHLAMDEFVKEFKSKSARVQSMTDTSDPEYLKARHMALEAACALGRFRAGLQDVYDRLHDPLGWHAPNPMLAKAATIDWLVHEAVDIDTTSATFWATCGGHSTFLSAEMYAAFAAQISEIEERPLGLKRVRSTDDGDTIYEMSTLVIVLCGDEDDDDQACWGISWEEVRWGPDPADTCRDRTWRTRAHGKQPMRYQNCPHCMMRMDTPFRIFSDTDCSVMVFIPPWVRVNVLTLSDSIGVAGIRPRIVVRGTGEPLTACKLQRLLGEWWWLFSDDSTGGARIGNMDKARDINPRLAAAQYTNALTEPL